VTGPALHAPYTGLAPLYDELVGDAGAPLIWRAFCAARRIHGIRFRACADFGCGTGRFLHRLATRAPPGTRLVGIDRSPAMLAMAQRRLRGLPVQLIEADLRSVRLAAAADLATCNFDTLNYLRHVSDLQSAVANFAANVTYDGHLIFDILRSDAIAPSAAAFRQRIELPAMKGDWLSRPAADGRGSVVEVNACMPVGPHDVCWREIHRQRWWALPLIITLLADAGWGLLGIHRLGDSAPAGAHDRWVQIVARRDGRSETRGRLRGGRRARQRPTRHATDATRPVRPGGA
jgi:SAM-dependent methyltransferase